MSYDPYAKLSKEKEDAISDLKYAYNFVQTCHSEYSTYWGSVYFQGLRREAIKILLENCGIYKHYKTGEYMTMYYMIEAAVNTMDWRSIRQKVNDWHGGRTRAPHGKVREVAHISKFVPGTHFHVEKLEGRKFNSLEDAKLAILRRDFQVGELMEKHVYRTEGD